MLTKRKNEVDLFQPRSFISIIVFLPKLPDADVCTDLTQKNYLVHPKN